MPKRKNYENSKNFKKAKYFNPNTKFLMPGNLGFLVSYNRGKEKDATMNCFRILNSFAEPIDLEPENLGQNLNSGEGDNQKNGRETLNSSRSETGPDVENSKPESGSEEEDEMIDFSKALSEEVEKKPEKVKKLSKARIFNKVDPGAKSMLFFKTDVKGDSLASS